MMSLMARRTWPPMPLFPALVSASSLGLLSAEDRGPRLPRTMFSSPCTGLNACGARATSAHFTTCAESGSATTQCKQVMSLQRQDATSVVESCKSCRHVLHMKGATRLR